jgi:hypothetical protein
MGAARQVGADRVEVAIVAPRARKMLAKLRQYGAMAQQ